jgi:hypothetical protein
MSGFGLNVIACVCFVIAAVAFYITGPLWLASLFTVLVLLTAYQLYRARA